MGEASRRKKADPYYGLWPRSLGKFPEHLIPTQEDLAAADLSELLCLLDPEMSQKSDCTQFSLLDNFSNPDDSPETSRAYVIAAAFLNKDKLTNVAVSVAIEAGAKRLDLQSKSEFVEQSGHILTTGGFLPLLIVREFAVSKKFDITDKKHIVSAIVFLYKTFCTALGIAMEALDELPDISLDEDLSDPIQSGAALNS